MSIAFGGRPAGAREKVPGHPNIYKEITKQKGVVYRVANSNISGTFKTLQEASDARMKAGLSTVYRKTGPKVQLDSEYISQSSPRSWLLRIQKLGISQSFKTRAEAVLARDKALGRTFTSDEITEKPALDEFYAPLDL